MTASANLASKVMELYPPISQEAQRIYKAAENLLSRIFEDEVIYEELETIQWLTLLERTPLPEIPKELEHLESLIDSVKLRFPSISYAKGSTNWLTAYYHLRELTLGLRQVRTLAESIGLIAMKFHAHIEQCFQMTRVFYDAYLDSYLAFFGELVLARDRVFESETPETIDGFLAAAEAFLKETKRLLDEEIHRVAVSPKEAFEELETLQRSLEQLHTLALLEHCPNNAESIYASA